MRFLAVVDIAEGLAPVGRKQGRPPAGESREGRLGVAEGRQQCEDQQVDFRHDHQIPPNHLDRKAIV
jgi:hypothetical protein